MPVSRTRFASSRGRSASDPRNPDGLRSLRAWLSRDGAVRRAPAAWLRALAPTAAALERSVLRGPHAVLWIAAARHLASRRGSVRLAARGRRSGNVAPVVRSDLGLEMNQVMLQGFLLGIIVTASLTAAVFFLKFWHQTRDPLFASFAAAFAIEGLNRV